MFRIETLDHVSLPVSNLAASKEFYGQTLGLREIARPLGMSDESDPTWFAGAWYEVGDRTLHLIVDEDSTFRKKDGAGKPLSSRDTHFAIRVKSFRATLEYLRSKGYTQDATDEAHL